MPFGLDYPEKKASYIFLFDMDINQRNH